MTAPTASYSSSKKTPGCKRPSTLRLLFGFGKTTLTGKSSLPSLQLLDAIQGINLILPRQVTPAVWAKNNLHSALQKTPAPAPASGTIGTNSPGSRTPTN